MLHKLVPWAPEPLLHPSASKSDTAEEGAMCFPPSCYYTNPHHHRQAKSRNSGEVIWGLEAAGWKRAGWVPSSQQPSFPRGKQKLSHLLLLLTITPDPDWSSGGWLPRLPRALNKKAWLEKVSIQMPGVLDDLSQLWQSSLRSKSVCSKFMAWE